MFYHKDEEVYACSNDISLTDAQLKAQYKSRWKCEVFHREPKQKLGLENKQSIHKSRLITESIAIAAGQDTKTFDMSIPANIYVRGLRLVEWKAYRQPKYKYYL